MRDERAGSRHRRSAGVGAAAFLFILAWSAGSPQAAEAFTTGDARPRIALIIDDLGNRRPDGERTVALQGPVACAILPHTPFARSLAEQAYDAGKEVLLHLPLQPMEQLLPVHVGAIQLDNTRLQFNRILDADLDAVPHIVGVNTHMGSLVTRHPGHMKWLMEALKKRQPLYFVDSYTTARSVALKLAKEYGVPAARRDVFLDNAPDELEIDKAFRRLKKLARENGSAIGIGHPHALTLEYLERELPKLRDDGFDLVPVSALVRGAAVTVLP